MKRIAKDPAARCEELVSIAEELFLKNGYEEFFSSRISEHGGSIWEVVVT